jgi:hypothetical protein
MGEQMTDSNGARCWLEYLALRAELMFDKETGNQFLETGQAELRKMTVIHAPK